MLEVEQLLVGARAGERPALQSLIQLYQRRIAGFVMAQTGDLTSCEDLCQNVFVKMVLGVNKLSTPAAFEAWLFQIARNVCRDWLRSQRWRRRLFEPLQGRHARVPDVVPDPGALRSPELEQAIAQLDPKERKLLSLTLERKRTYGELAEQLGLSVSATKSRLFRMREHLGELVRAGHQPGYPKENFDEV